jgi:dephospho-CoA kinase
MKNIFLGLTGNIGSGKTTVLNLFHSKGFRVLNADEMVHGMFVANHPFYSQLSARIDDYFKTSFSDSVLIDRNILRPLVKSDPNALQVLADIVKPFITEEILREKNNPVDTIIEVPLLFEGSNKDAYDKVILVYCDDEERQRRIKIRNPNWGDDYIQTMMAAQMKQEEKLKMADYVIFNHQNIELNEQIDNIISFIKTDQKLKLSYRNK